MLCLFIWFCSVLCSITFTREGIYMLQGEILSHHSILQDYCREEERERERQRE